MPTNICYPGFRFTAAIWGWVVRRVMDNFHSKQLIMLCLHSPAS